MKNVEMKTIEYRGRQYRVPVWVKFVATDEDGSIYGWANKPQVSGGMWCSNGDTWCLYSTHNTDWDNSLAEVA